MTLPRLDSATVDAYLARLGRPAISLDSSGLARLQRAHLRALPFHNLALLAGMPGLLPVEAAVEDNIAGVGGGPLLLTPPFVALLRALGFEAWLAAASIDEPGDHCVGLVQLPEGRFVVDVGHGQPYLQPFPLQGGPLDFTSYGWSFRFEHDEREGYRLRRILSNGQVRTVYRLHPEPRAYAAFESHVHTSRGWTGSGPLLTQVHAARMSDWGMVMVHEGLYQRFAGGLTSTRPVADWETLAELLRITFGLPEKLLERALDAVRRSGPKLGREARPSQPGLRFILSLAVTERADSTRELLRSLDELLERSQRSRGQLGILLLDNSRPQPGGGMLDEVLEETRRMGLRVARVDAREVLDRLAPFQRHGLLPTPLSVPLPIGASRTLQTALLHEHLQTGALGLPHPGDGEGPVAVWMLDDDLAFRRLWETHQGLQSGPGDDLLARAESLWARHPEVSVVLGTFTGEPPIPGYATLQVQLHDLAANLGAMGERPPDSPWSPGDAPRDLRDYYYDHARGSMVHLEAVFPWRPPAPPPWRVREAFGSLCRAFAHVPHGQQITRPLTYRPTNTLVPSRDRGGNALFLDLDSLVVAPYPVLRGEDGVVARRADTLWAHLATREPLLRIAQADLDLLHGRRLEDGSSPLAERQPDPRALRRFVEAQERGVVLARLLEGTHLPQASAAAREIAERRGLLARSREGVRREIAKARALLAHPDAWWWREPEDAASARSCLTTLRQVEELASALDALEDPSLPEQLAGFARHMIEALPAWRSTWV